MRKVMETSQAVAEAIKLCKPSVIPIYPITPQTHIVEKIAEFVNDGELDAELIHVESEHSALSAAVGASATGVRAYTATASQGLALMHEILFVASGMRLPIVMTICNRALSAPINIWNDHQDSFSARDAGWIQIYVESAQEALDATIQAFKIAENREVLTPIMVCLDGFTLSHVYEPVDIPQQGEVNKFLPKYRPSISLDPKKPMTLGPIGYPESYMLFKKDQQNAICRSIDVIKKVHNDFAARFKRNYGDGLIEGYKTNGAKTAFVAMGTVCGTLRTVVDDLRANKKKVGLIKLRTFRPFPYEELAKECKKLSSIIVIDRDISLGQEGSLASEIKSLFNERRIKTAVHGFIAGLGGRDITPRDLQNMLRKAEKSKAPLREWLC